MPKLNSLTFPNLHYGLLRKICSSKPGAIARKYGLTAITGKRGTHYFKDNNADILAVAHLDSQIGFQHFTVARGKPDTLIYCQTLDDRLGAYLILEWLQTAGIKCDILLTEGEENMKSTAKDFIPPQGKKYNWMFSFDRKGTDVVTYQYGTSEPWLSALVESGVEEINYGAYSDIAELEHLEVAGANFGCGYQNNHGMWAYASKNDLLLQLKRFMNFYRKNAHTTFIVREGDAFSSSISSSQLNLFKKASTNVTSQLLTNPKSKEHKAAAKEEANKRIAAFREKQEREKKSENYNIDFKAMLMTDIGILNLPIEIIFKLYKINVLTVADLVSRTGTQLLNLPEFSMRDLDAIRTALKILDPAFTLAMSVSLYGVTAADMKAAREKATKKSTEITKTNDKVESLLITQNNPDFKLVKLQGTKFQTKPSEDKIIVSHPLPLTNASAKFRETNITDTCKDCFRTFDVSELNQDLRCIQCEAVYNADRAREEASQKGISSDGEYIKCKVCHKVKIKDSFFEHPDEKKDICVNCESDMENKQTEDKRKQFSKKEIGILEFELSPDWHYTIADGWCKNEVSSEFKKEDKNTTKAFEEFQKYNDKTKLENTKLREELKSKEDLLAPFTGHLREQLVDHFIFSIESLCEKTKKDLYFLTKKELTNVKSVLKAKGLSLNRNSKQTTKENELKQVGFPAEPN